MEFLLQPEKKRHFKVICSISATYFRHQDCLKSLWHCQREVPTLSYSQDAPCPFPKSMQGKLTKSLTSHLLCQPHTLYISIYSIFLPSYSEQWPPAKPAHRPDGLWGQRLTGVVPALYHFCQSKVHGAITAIHIMPTAAGARGWTGALCHLCQISVIGLSGPINLYSSISLAEFTNLRLWLHQMWMSHFCWPLSEPTHLPTHRHCCIWPPSVKIRAGTDAQLCLTAGTCLDDAGTATR